MLQQKEHSKGFLVARKIEGTCRRRHQLLSKIPPTTHLPIIFNFETLAACTGNLLDAAIKEHQTNDEEQDRHSNQQNH